jgi:hypothetical protein
MRPSALVLTALAPALFACAQIDGSPEDRFARARTGYGPWILKFGFPLGALVFLYFRTELIRARAEAERVLAPLPDPAGPA